LGAFVLKNSTASFFAPEVARMALGGGFRTSYVDRNPKCENTPNTSFGSNGVDWCVRFKKFSYKFFRSRSGLSAVGAGFA
jgi:hypothetical protein